MTERKHAPTVKRQCLRCELLLAMAEADSSPEATRCLHARQNLLAAKTEAAAASLVCAQAKARVLALEER